ncbi:LamG-like jellyroll fold domain-containing protein (plasmid) [Verrucomicrobiaceae bacterium 227]
MSPPSLLTRLALAAILYCSTDSASGQILPDDLTLSVQVDGNTRTLNLSKYSQRAANFVYYTWSAPTADAENTGVYVEDTANAPQVRTFRGTVAEEPNTLLMASIRPGNKLYVSAFDHLRGRGHIWTLDNVDITAQLATATPGNPYPVRPTGGFAEMELAIDINWHKRVNNNGDDPDLSMVIAEHEAAIYDHFMARDVDTAIVLSCVVSRTGEHELVPYTDNHLFDIAEEWTRATQPLATAPWDQVHSFAPSTGLPPGVGGYAWQNRIGKTDTPGRGVGSIGVNAMYHESGGHNWDAVHLGYGKDNMGGNRPSQGIFNRPRVIQKRDARILTGDLAQPLGNYPSPVHPYGHADLVTTPVDTAIAIDVLANDADSNGDTLSVVAFSATSGKGGTVTQSGNLLTYTPPVGYVGKDLITYTVQDSSSLQLQTRDLVFVEVINHDLTIHYDFEETNGTSTANLTGLGHPGELLNSDFSAATEGAPVGQGLRVPSDGMVIDSSPALPPGVTTTNDSNFYPFDNDMATGNYFDPMDQDFAVGLWFRSDDLSTSQDVFSKYWAAEQGTGMRLYVDSSGVHVVIREIEGIYGKLNINSPVALQEGQWHHLALSIDRDTDVATLFIDGTDAGTVALHANSHIFHGTKQFLIAANNQGQVTIDDFRLWTRPVLEAEIDAIIDAAVLPPTNPNPANGAFEITTNSPSLLWTTPEAATAFRVYLGPDRAAVLNATTTSPEYLGEVTTTSASAGILDQNSTYYWRVDQIIGGTAYPGAVWEFSTTVDETLLNADLYAWWTLDETTGSTAADSSGNNRVGIVTGAIAWMPGIVGGAACFNGTDTDITYDLIDTTLPAYSASFWALPSSLGQPNYSGVFNNSSSGSDFQFDVNGGNPGEYQFKILEAGTRIGTVAESWTHFAVVCDGNDTRVYLNGQLKAVREAGGNVFGQLQLGKDRNGSPRFHGCIDELRVWERAIDRSEIYDLFSAPLPVQRREYYTLDGGSSGINQLKNDPDYPASPNLDVLQAHLEIPSGGSNDNYGASLRALLVPEVSGDYTFYISADDQAELLLSTDERADNASLIASVPNFTASREWTKYASQKSITITLEAGKSYFIEALFVEASGGDHVAVGWEGPGMPLDIIPTSVLRRYHETPVVTPSEFARFNFENSEEGWDGTAQGSYDWLRNSGPTPTPNTGPLVDHTTGNAIEGFYYYFDTSPLAAFNAGNEAHLVSPVIDPAVRRALSFHYYMYGSDSGELHLDVHDGTSWNNSIWSISGQQQTNQTEDWIEENVSLTQFTGPIQVRFRAVAAGGLLGNTAIDSITFSGFVAPEFTMASIDLGTAPAATPYQFDLNSVVTDTDEGDILNYTKISGPAWGEVTPGGFLSGTPPIDQLGVQPFVVQVEDSFGSTAQATATLTTVNGAPVWAADPQDIGSAQANLPYSISVRQFVNDPNVQDTFTFTKLSGPDWFAIDSAGRVSGTPLTADTGPATVRIRVNDFHGLSAEADLTILVEETGLYYDTSSVTGLNFGNKNWNTTEAFWNADASGLADLSPWPGAAFVAIFNTGGSSTATLTEDIRAAGLVIDSGSVTLTGEELSLGSGGISIAESLTANLPDLDLSAPQTWNLGTGSLLNVRNVESNGHALTFDGTGDVVVTDGDNGATDLNGGGDIIWNSSGTMVIHGRNHTSGDLIVNNGIVELRSFVWHLPNFGGRAIVNTGGTLRPDTQSFGFFGRAVDVLGGTLDAFNTVYLGESGKTSNFQAATVTGSASFNSRGNYKILASDTTSTFSQTGGLNLYQPLSVEVEAGTANPAVQFDTRLYGGNSFTKTGVGTMVFNTQGDSNMSGDFNVNSGTVLLNGALSNNSNLSVAAGATLGGNASYASPATIAGTISPGSAIGSISTGGSLTFSDNSTYLADIIAPDNDRIDVAGDLHIGNNVTLNLSDATVDGLNAPYILLTYSGVRDGAFIPTGVPAGWIVVQDRTLRQVTLEPINLESTEREWLSRHFTEAELEDPTKEATHWGHAADPDGDTLSNFFEFAYGSDPKVAGGAQRTVDGEPGTNNLRSTFVRLRHNLLDYQLQVSSDLDSWATASTTANTPTVIDQFYEEITLVLDEDPSEFTNRYIRLAATEPGG